MDGAWWARGGRVAGAWLVEPATGLLRAFYGPLRAAQGRSGPLRARGGRVAGGTGYRPATGLLRAFYGPLRATTAAYSSQPRTRPTPRAAAAPTACRPPTAAHSLAKTTAHEPPRRPVLPAAMRAPVGRVQGRVGWWRAAAVQEDTQRDGRARRPCAALCGPLTG